MYQSTLQGIHLPGVEATPFVLIGPGRSGSTLVQTLLDSHPNCVCMNELWQQKSSMWRGYYVLHRKSWSTRNFNEITHNALCSPQPPWIHSVGFKVLYGQPQDETQREITWEHLLGIKNLKIVRVKRNLIQSTISAAIARATGYWINKPTTEPIELEVELVKRIYERKIKLEYEMDQKLSEWSIFELNFEAFTRDLASQLQVLQTFLGLTPLDLKPTLKRQNKKPHSEMIQNWDVINSMFQNHTESKN